MQSRLSHQLRVGLSFTRKSNGDLIYSSQSVHVIPRLGSKQLLQVVWTMRSEQGLEEARGLLHWRPPGRGAQPRVLVIAIRAVSRAITEILDQGSADDLIMVTITWIAMHLCSWGQRNGSKAGHVKGRAEVRRGVVTRMRRPLIMVTTVSQLYATLSRSRSQSGTVAISLASWRSAMAGLPCPLSGLW